MKIPFSRFHYLYSPFMAIMMIPPEKVFCLVHFIYSLFLITVLQGGLGDPLAALDLLSASNLINYFGKAASVEDIEITPILLRKGPTNIAIYGLGAMRDERLNRMWNLKKVRFVRLTAEQGRDEYFNIFLIHQNRDLGRGTKNCIHESMIPEWMGKHSTLYLC